MTNLRIIARCVLMLAGAAASTMTLAQALAPSAATAAAAAKAQKETDRTMYWIRVLATTPAAKPAAAATPKPVAAVATVAQARQVASERVRVAAASPSQQTYTDAGPSAPSNTAAAAPKLGASGNGNAMASGATDAGVASAGLAASLAAPSATAAQIDVPAEEEPADPGLVMMGSADPEFPAATMRRLRKGSVEVKFEVNTDGIVTAASVTSSSHPTLNAAAVEAVRQWRFQPTYKGHTAMVDLKFDLDS